MTNFYVLDGSKSKQGTAVNAEKATEMLNLMFPGQKAFIVDGGKVPFAQNMTIAEAESSAGIKPTVVEPVVVVEPVTQFMEVLPEEPKTIKVKSKVAVKSTSAKKTKVKSKVVVAKKAAKKPVKKVVKKPVAKKKPVVKKKK